VSGTDLTDWRFVRAIKLKGITDRTRSTEGMRVWWRHFYVRDNFEASVEVEK
jgi:hypothetical protein